MIRVGLTGNIGSGKSTIANIFVALGVQVYHSDEEAKKILNSMKVRGKLISKFGHDIIDKNKVDRKFLAKLVFNDNKKLNDLNSIIHPLVKESQNLWFNQFVDQQYVIQEAAILFESGFHEDCDKIITVVCHPELAVRRVMKRDGLDRKAVMERMNNQWPQDVKIKQSDFVVINDESMPVIPQIINIHTILNNKKRAFI